MLNLIVLMVMLMMIRIAVVMLAFLQETAIFQKPVSTAKLLLV